MASPKYFTLSNGTTGKVVHLHGNGEVFEVIEELEERPELFKGDALIMKEKSKKTQG